MRHGLLSFARAVKNGEVQSTSEGMSKGRGGRGKRPAEGCSADRSQGGHAVTSKLLWYQDLCQDHVVLGTDHLAP